jgi:hypothetical protein
VVAGAIVVAILNLARKAWPAAPLGNS